MKVWGSSLMVGGFMREDETKILIRCPDRLNFDGYMDVLNKEMLPTYGHKDIFQWDNAQYHKSRVVSYFMNNCRICCLSEWQLQSPNLYIIVIWFKSQCCKSVVKLWRTCEDKLIQIHIEKIYKCIKTYLGVLKRS